MAQEKNHGLIITVPVFAGEGVDSTFARVYGLTPGDIAALNTAIKAAKEKFTGLSIQAAKFQMGADGSSFVVDVPPVADQGGVIYDQLLQTFKSVLGPERFQSFNDLSGDNFDRSFGEFGLWSSHYEVSELAQPSAKHPAVRLNGSSIGPNGSSTSAYTISVEQLSKQYPVLGHFVPEGFGAPRR